jgi:hypothetical protein
MNWGDSEILVDLPVSLIELGPEYDPATFNRDNEETLYRHYGHIPYWEATDDVQAAQDLAGKARVL